MGILDDGARSHPLSLRPHGDSRGRPVGKQRPCYDEAQAAQVATESERVRVDSISPTPVISD